MKKIKASYALLIAVGLLMTLKLSATTYTNTALTGLWGSSGSWSGAQPSVGGAADAVIVLNPSANAVITNDMSGAFSLNQLKLVANKHETLQSINGSSLSFAGSGASITNVGSGGNFTINSPITLGADLMVGNASSVKLTLSSNITESVASGLILNSESTRLVYLAGSNTFSGGVTLNGGGVEINNAASLGTGTFTINNGTTFNNIGPSTVALANASVWNGNIAYVGSAANLTMNGPVTLGSNVTLAVNGFTLTVNGNITGPYSLTKVGTSVLTLGGANSFSGDFVWGAGTLNVYSSSGLPLGSGSLTVSNGLTLSITPSGSGSAVALSGGTNGNETISFNGKAKIYVNSNLQSSVTYTFGNSTDTNSVFVRNGRGLLSIIDTINSGGIGVKGQFKLANGTNGVPIHNGMVDAYLTASDQTPFFMQYNEATGFQKYTYSYSWGNGIQASVNDNTRVYQTGGGVNTKTVLTNDCSIYALSMPSTGQSLILSNNAVLYLGNGIQPAGLILQSSTIAAAANSTGSRLDFGASEGIVYHTYNCAAAINVPIAGSGGVTFYINPAYKDLTLSEDNTYTGDTTLHGGNPLNIGTGGTRGSLASTNWIITGGTLNFNRSDTLTWAGTMSGAGTVQNGGVGTLNLALSSGTTYGGTLANASSGTMNLTLSSNTLTTVQNTGVGTLTVSALSGSSNTYANINNNSTGTLVLDGVGSTNILTGSFGGAAGGTLVFSNGYYSSTGQRNTKGNLTIAGGTLAIGARLGFGNQSDGQTMTITGGSLILNTQYGFAFGAEGATTGNYSATVNQSGGLVSVLASSASPSMMLGGTTASKTDVYNLSGGTINLVSGNSGQSLSIAADVGGTTLAKFSMTGGKLISGGNISGSQGTGAKQVFDFSGGTLAASTIDATKLSSAATPSVQGTLMNNGGTLAPGDIGTAGKTTITGSYSNVPASVLAIDIGGTTQATAFQTGQYDYLRVDVGATTLAGQLRVNLINSYVPLTTNRFIVLLCTNGLSGAFANVTAGKVWCADGYSLFTNVTQNTTNVILSGYAVNEYLGVNWDNTASWSQGVIPVDQNYAAYFGTLASDFSPNVGTRTLKGLVFANTSSFTLSGTALTLQGDASIKVTAGSHTISAPLALSNVTEIAVATNSVMTLTGGITGGQAVAKTGTGTLALGGANTLLGALTVSAGTVRFTAGTTTVSGLTIASGAKCDFVTGTLYILKNGGGMDTIEEVNAAITANSITRRGSNALPADFKVTEEGDYIKVTAMLNGTLIIFL